MNDLITMEIDATTKEWTGTIPKHYGTVGLQFLNDGQWEPPLNKLLPRKRQQAIDETSEAVGKGKLGTTLKYSKYRLVALEGDTTASQGEEQKEQAMPKKTATKKKAAVGGAGNATRTQTEKPKPNLIFGRFKSGSIGGLMCEFLQDGKPHTVAEIAKHTKAQPQNIAGSGGWFPLLKKYGDKSGLFEVKKLDDGKLQMIVAGGKKSPAAPAAAPKAETSGAKNEGSKKTTTKEKDKKHAAAPKPTKERTAVAPSAKAAKAGAGTDAGSKSGPVTIES